MPQGMAFRPFRAQNATMSDATASSASDAIPQDLSEVRDWVTLLKPRVISLVVLTGIVGMMVAPGHLAPALAIAAVLCIALGAYISAASMLVFFYVVYRTFTSKEKLADNYWGEGATTLEWQVSSPPPFHTFEELPRVR